MNAFGETGEGSERRRSLLFRRRLTGLARRLYRRSRGEKRMREKIVQTAGRDRLGDFAPEFAHFNAERRETELAEEIKTRK